MKQIENVYMELITFTTQDVITTSGFSGEKDDLGNVEAMDVEGNPTAE